MDHTKADAPGLNTRVSSMSLDTTSAPGLPAIRQKQVSKVLDSEFWTLGHRQTHERSFMVFLALQLCDKVDAYGFITDQHKKYSNYYYERGANTHMVFYANHNYDMEREMWRKLHDLGIINLYLENRKSLKRTTRKRKT
ncbi:hypothetical protein WMY93_010132 [Mugilogobius chulae]|uniref:alpha-N-acetylgalactosaminide alpha-2,6-sialyltransferase n=1 Tax=Mugilogobius chulae TaxID=88201 RepID=A0AAW0P6N8_9GOBI